MEAVITLSREEAEASLAKWLEENPNKHVRKGYAALGDDITFSRFVKIKGKPRRGPQPMRKQLALPGLGRPSIEQGRSFFHKKGVKHPDDLTNLLVSAHSNPKIGRDVRVGKLFRGYWIYTLSLEERATCPRSCKHWLDCYGNGMPYATRVDHTDESALFAGLERDIQTVLAKREGLLVRLHALGDFYDVWYVRFWLNMLHTYPNLAIFGYTARTPGDPIGDAVALGKTLFGRRFALRYSDGGMDEDCTASIPDASRKPDNAFICPEQTGGVDGCGKCGLCWNKTKNVAFLDH